MKKLSLKKLSCRRRNPVSFIRRWIVAFLAISILLSAGLESLAAEQDLKKAAAGVVQIIAHRGASAERPECTLSAIRQAIEVGATAVEVDVRTSKDGALFILHDVTLDRTTNGSGIANALSLAELQQLDAGSWFGPAYRGERIPSLIQAAESCRGTIDLWLDLKEQGDDYDRKVAEVIREHGDPARTIVGVRSIAQAQRFRELLPKARQLALIPSVDSIEEFAEAGVDIIRIWPIWLADGDGPVDRVRASGRQLHLNGTPGEIDETLKLLAFKPDSLSSDDPGKLKTTLATIARGNSQRDVEESLSFGRDIQPLLSKHCVLCHGPDDAEAGLRLDVQEKAYAELDSGERAIVPGDPDASELVRRITTEDDSERMPPVGEGEALSKQEIAMLREWIENGAKYEQHWAYRELNVAAPPVVKDESWIRNSIDRFVLARLEQEGVSPSPEANRPTLIKRLYYDLIGIPPTVEEVDAFVSDQSLEAYSKLVRRLLASKHFGERWGRHWLDKARYADSDGYEKDRPRPNAWHYRDWVIDAVNADMPMDQFTMEQLAGDLLPEATNSQKLATAFHRQTLTNTEGGADQEEFRVEATFDRTETTSTIWLGLTMTCARCHTHKYDAIRQAEYYQLFAFFNNGQETDTKLPASKEAAETYVRQKADYDAKLKAVDEQIASAKSGHEPAFETWTKDIQELLSNKEPPEYFGLDEVSAKSESVGVDFELEAEGIVQVSGANPDSGATYEVNAKFGEIGKQVTGIRIDALTDKRLPANGPGRVAHGNFVINEIEVFAGERKFEFSGATADFSQTEFEASKLIDGNTDERNGWAIAPQMGKPHHVVLKFKSPFDAMAGESLTVRLIQNYGKQHFVGRFQIRMMTGQQAAGLPPKEISQVFGIASNKRNVKQNAKLLDYFFKTGYVPTKKLFVERAALQKDAPKEPVTLVRVITEQKRQTKIMERGDFLNATDEVNAAGLSVLPPIDGRQEAVRDRLDLAQWLMSESNPLTPRVLANQVWEKLFGEGIVRTMNDFGVRGDPPTHPELLDWLGTEYRRLGWSRKKMIETIVMSSAYRQSAAHRAELLNTDPTNRWLARQNRFRVSAEIVRDICLSTAGLLSEKVGGPSVFPPMPPEVAALSYANSFKWSTSKGEDRYRRGMYTFFKRTAPHPNLLAFDCPDSNTTNVQRRDSNTPIQALTMLNNEVFIEASQAFAKRVLELDASDDQDRIAKALRICVGRTPADSEIARFVNLLKKSRTYYRRNSDDASKLIGAYRPQGVEQFEAASWVTVTRILLNLDEVITRE